MRNNIVALFVAAALAQAAAAQEADTSGADALEQVVVTGTRVANRSVLDTAVPVDVVSSDGGIAVVQLPASGFDRRHGHRSPCHAS